MNISKIKWLYSRFSIMSVAEVVFRVKQAIQKYKERAGQLVPVYKSVSVVEIPFDHSSVITFPSPNLLIYNFFGKSIDISGSIDFHKDIFSGKSFPRIFSKDIDTRSSQYGDAKVVWEVSRLQFLLPIIIEYKKTNDAKQLDRFIDIMEDWAEQNPYMQGVNWYSNIEVNIRLINWYWCWVVLQDDKMWRTNSKYQKFKQDVWLPLIYQHCVYSHANPSYYSSANNHLISEYAGLFVSTTIWKFPETEQWLKDAIEGLEREIVLQHSARGVNKEEAAEYIQFITDFFLIPYVVGQRHNISFSSSYQALLLNMCRYIYDFIDIKGNYPKYGDEDDGKVIVPNAYTHDNNFLSILNTAAVLFNEADFKLPISKWDIKSALLTAHIKGHETWPLLQITSRKNKSVFYKDEGHFFFRKTDDTNEIYFHFDAAHLGFLSLAAHGHADALSVLLHVDGYPILVDPGTYTYYESKEWRSYFVNTANHNTLTFNGQNQAKQAGAMLWLNHFKCKVQLVQIGQGIEKVSASHNGYRSMQSTHQRSTEFDRDNNTILIDDDIVAGDKVKDILMHWHLHPSVNISRSDVENEFILQHIESDKKIHLKLPAGAGEINIADGWYSKSFMEKESCKVINLKINITLLKKLSLKTQILIS